MFGIAGNLLNIGLDYLFIVKLQQGMKGAAVASGLSILIPFILGGWYFLSKHSVYKFRAIRFCGADVRQMLYYGFAEFMAQISVSITTYLFNWVLLRRLGAQGVAAMTIVGYVALLQNMIFTGIAAGIHPLLSYHFGARNAAPILRLLAVACQTALAVGAFILCLALWAGNGIVKIFAGGNPALQQLAGAGLKLYATSFVLSGFNIIAAAYFTSVGAAGRAATVSILRSLVWVSLLLWILPGWLGNAGIWLTVPLTELLTFFMAYPWVRRSGAILRSGWEGEYSV